MYAVIFQAEIDELDERNYAMAAELWQLAIDRCGCIEFTSATEGTREIASSYLRDRVQIEQ